jgi:hypothetical protein
MTQTLYERIKTIDTSIENMNEQYKFAKLPKPVICSIGLIPLQKRIINHKN